jgi:hypothetical protein
MAEENQDKSNEGWHRIYPEGPINSRREVKETLRRLGTLPPFVYGRQRKTLTIRLG